VGDLVVQGAREDRLLEDDADSLLGRHADLAVLDVFGNAMMLGSVGEVVKGRLVVDRSARRELAAGGCFVALGGPRMKDEPAANAAVRKFDLTDGTALVSVRTLADLLDGLLNALGEVVLLAAESGRDGGRRHCLGEKSLDGLGLTGNNELLGDRPGVGHEAASDRLLVGAGKAHRGHVVGQVFLREVGKEKVKDALLREGECVKPCCITIRCNAEVRRSLC
jgi:hypothetical protein